MTQITKPMLASAVEDLSKIKFPIICSPKYDGIRCVKLGTKVLTRSFKPIPNKYVQDCFNQLDCVDGELIVGNPFSSTVYRDTVSHVMSHDKVDFDLHLYAIDHVRFPEKPYHDRQALLYFDSIRFPTVHTLEQKVIMDQVSMLQYEEEMLDLGYEGLILRDPNAPYKCGRSTVKEGYLLKLKRFIDAEATVIGFEERMHNGNEATTNELGRTKRSSHAAGKTGRGDLGALIVRYGDIEFNIGTGFDDIERADIWNNRDKYLGCLSKFKYFPVGVKEAPRHPVFLGWRDQIDT